MKRFLILTAALVALGCLAVTVLLLLSPGNAAPRPLPSPNAYDAFLKEGQALGGAPPSLKTAEPAAVRAYVEANAAVLARIRKALALQSAVPWVPTDAFMTAHPEQLGALKSGGVLLLSAAVLEESQGRPTAALDGYLEGTRYAKLVTAEGMVIDQLVGEALGGLALERLAGLAPKLNEADRTRMLTELVKWDQSMDPPATVAMREAAMMARIAGTGRRITFGIANAVTRLRGGRTISAVTLQSLNSALAKRTLRLAAVAVAAFVAENHRLPVRWEEVCPKCLPAAPLDPFVNQQMLLKRTGDTLLVYSVGPDLKDNGGVPLKPGSSQATGDIVIEIPAAR